MSLESVLDHVGTRMRSATEILLLLRSSIFENIYGKETRTILQTYHYG